MSLWKPWCQLISAPLGLGAGQASGQLRAPVPAHSADLVLVLSQLLPSFHSHPFRHVPVSPPSPSSTMPVLRGVSSKSGISRVIGFPWHGTQLYNMGTSTQPSRMPSLGRSLSFCERAKKRFIRVERKCWKCLFKAQNIFSDLATSFPKTFASDILSAVLETGLYVYVYLKRRCCISFPKCLHVHRGILLSTTMSTFPALFIEYWLFHLLTEANRSKSCHFVTKMEALSSLWSTDMFTYANIQPTCFC